MDTMDLNNQSYDEVSLSKDMAEREQIIKLYKNTGYLDRDDAIKKIKELRVTDGEVAAVTAIKLAQNSVPFEHAPNEALIMELQMQVEILAGKSLRNLGKNN